MNNPHHGHGHDHGGHGGDHRPPRAHGKFNPLRSLSRSIADQVSAAVIAALQKEFHVMALSIEDIRAKVSKEIEVDKSAALMLREILKRLRAANTLEEVKVELDRLDSSREDLAAAVKEGTEVDAPVAGTPGTPPITTDPNTGEKTDALGRKVDANDNLI